MSETEIARHCEDAMSTSEHNGPYVVLQEGAACERCGAGATWSVVYMPSDVALSTTYDDRDEAERLAGDLNEAFQRGRDVGLRSQVAEPGRRIEDLRVSLIQAINTALSRAGVELPTSAAATVEPVPPKYTTVAECLHVDNLEASAAATAEPSVTGEVPLSFRLMVERDAARAEVKALEDWRADVTVALQRPGGALFADVPKHVRDLVGERDDLKRQLYAGQPRIATRCPACGGSTLFVGHGGHLTCSRLECPNPSVADEIKRIADQLAEATEWRPMREHIAAPTIVAWRGEGGRVGVYGACNFGPLPKHQQTDALGWLPIPPYRAKEGQ
jgi:hypothetical protein